MGRGGDWFEAGFVMSRGERLTHSFGESPSVAVESSLSQILEPSENVNPKYFLSKKACQGILRRAEKRGKVLPKPLLYALLSKATASTDSLRTVETEKDTKKA